MIFHKTTLFSNNAQKTTNEEFKSQILGSPPPPD